MSSLRASLLLYRQRRPRVTWPRRTGLFLARALGFISAPLLDSELLGIFGSRVGALITARTRRQPNTAGRVGLRVVAAATSAKVLVQHRPRAPVAAAVRALPA